MSEIYLNISANQKEKRKKKYLGNQKERVTDLEVIVEVLHSGEGNGFDGTSSDKNLRREGWEWSFRVTSGQGLVELEEFRVAAEHKHVLCGAVNTRLGHCDLVNLSMERVRHCFGAVQSFARGFQLT